MNQRRFKEVYVKSGDPYERGRQHGSQIRDNILRICKGYEGSFAKKGFTMEEVFAMAMEYVPYLEEEMPDLMAEARGIADGAQVDLAVVMMLNLRYELLKLKKETPETMEQNAECTCFCALPEATKEGGTLSGQNWDKSEFVEKELYVIHIDEENGNRILGLTEPAQLIRNGMNTAGLSLNCSTLLSIYDKKGHAIPTNFMRRRLLQCQTIEEAEAILEKFRPDVSLNYMLASKTGKAVVFETNPKENFRIDPCRGILAKGNDFLCDPSIDRFIPADKEHVRHFRGQRLTELMKKQRGAITAESMKECLRDHYGYPGSVCNHLTERNLKTIASMIYVLDEGYAWMAWGNPCENEYERYEL